MLPACPLVAHHLERTERVPGGRCPPEAAQQRGHHHVLLRLRNDLRERRAGDAPLEQQRTGVAGRLSRMNNDGAVTVPEPKPFGFVPGLWMQPTDLEHDELRRQWEAHA